jgi:hypothetical protein
MPATAGSLLGCRVLKLNISSAQVYETTSNITSLFSMMRLCVRSPDPK